MSDRDLAALVMAGGRGERMQSSGMPVPKPLVPVRGVPLLERSLWSLAGAGVPRVVVSVACGADRVETCAREVGGALARALSWQFEVLIEEAALGNVGCAGALRGEVDHVLMIYADNLTLVPLDDLVSRHRERGADLTLATHRQVFRMPFGALEVKDGRVVAYHEKPSVNYAVSSAVCVLGAGALERLDGRAAGLADLASLLLASGRHVAAYEHASAWIDVNDAASVTAAESMVQDHVQAFEAWAPRVDVSQVLWIAGSAAGFVVGPGLGAVDPPPSLPRTECASREDAHAVAAAVRSAAGFRDPPHAEIVELDDVTPEGRFMRTYAFIESDLPRNSLRSPWSWCPKSDLLRQPEAARSIARAGLGVH